MSVARRDRLRLVALLIATALTVATPVKLWGAMLLYGVGAALGMWVGRVAWRRVRQVLTLEMPFLLFVLLLPWWGPAPYTEVVGGVHISAPGALAAGGIVCKGLLVAAYCAAATAGVSGVRLVRAAESLRAPRLLVQIAAFALRYGVLVEAQWRSLERARAARGYDARRWRPAARLRLHARCVAALLWRALERGERVHAAMLARGYEAQRDSR
jgi:cobalt/nickel transport system permease protein